MKKLVIFFMWILSFIGFGQEESSYFLTMSNKGGVMTAHRSFMAHLVRDKTFGFELAISKQKIEKSIFSSKQKFLLNGLALEYRNFGYNEVLGKAISLIQYQNFVIFQSNKNLCLDFKLGSGISYITNKYHKETNPTNNAIGSNINAKVSFKLELNKFTTHYHFGLGAELAHYSNGTFQHPNLGLNTIAVYVNIGYNFNKRKVFDFDENIIKKIKYTSKGYFIGEGIFSISEVLPVPADAKKYPVFAGRFSFVKPLSLNWNYELAIDGVYNVSNQFKYPNKNHEAKDVTQLGLYAGLSFNYYKSQIVFGMGYYIIDKINPLGFVYNRVGYRYFFNKNLFGLFNIRANFGKADFFEFGMGYKFNRK